jgi:hypothetical protein
MTSAEALDHALLELAEPGKRTPCQGGRRGRWTSDDADERAWAASVCRSLRCPVLVECGAAAAERREQFAVWGGVDHTATVQHKRRAC